MPCTLEVRGMLAFCCEEADIIPKNENKPMKERIYKYLVEQNRTVSSQEIIEKFFHVLNHYPPQLENIVASILKDDPRFVRDQVAEWHVQKKDDGENLADVVFSIIEIESIETSQYSYPDGFEGIHRKRQDLGRFFELSFQSRFH